MSIEDRVRRVLLDAVATEPPPAGAPFEQALRRRRRRPLVAATVALTLLLVAAVAVTEVRARDTRPVAPTPSTVSGAWKEFRDAGSNLSFRYPPGWVVRVRPGRPRFLVVPQEFADRSLENQLPFVVAFDMGLGQYHAAPTEHPSTGRLPSGRAYTKGAEQIGTRLLAYHYIDAGRFCSTDGPVRGCGAHRIEATIAAGSKALRDRYLPVATSIVGAAAPATATKPFSGDRTRPPCRPDQWGLLLEDIWFFHGRSWVIQGGVRYPADGPPCHLRVTLRVGVERPDGTPMAVPGTPAPITVEGDLPDDRMPGASGYVETSLAWHWTWQNWCRQPLGQTRIRVTAAGKSVTKLAPLQENYTNCQGVGRTAPWRIIPWP